MENTFSDGELQDLNTWDEYSNQIIFPSPTQLGRPSPRMKYLNDDFSLLPLPFQSDTIDEEYDLNNSLEPVQRILKMTKKIEKKTKKLRKQQKTNNPILNAARDFSSQIKQSNPGQQIQQFQQMKSLIDNLEEILGQVKHQLLTQVQQKGSRV